MKLKAKQVELDKPDVSKEYLCDFLTVTQQVKHVMEKLNVKTKNVTVLEGKAYYKGVFSPNRLDKFTVYIEIYQNNENSSTVNLDIRSEIGIKPIILEKKLDRFRAEFFRLLDSETSEAGELKDAYSEFLEDKKRSHPDKELYDMRGKWSPSGSLQHSMLVMMSVLLIGSIFISTLVLFGFIFDEGSFQPLVIALIIFTLFWFVALWDFLGNRNGRIRVVGIRVARNRGKVLEIVEEALSSLNIQCTSKRNSNFPFKAVYHCKASDFIVRVHPFTAEYVQILIRPVKDESQSIIDMLMWRLDEIFIEEGYSFLEFQPTRK